MRKKQEDERVQRDKHSQLFKLKQVRPKLEKEKPQKNKVEANFKKEDPHTKAKPT